LPLLATSFYFLSCTEVLIIKIIQIILLETIYNFLKRAIATPQ
jgi:hypothetical protein